MSYGNIIRWNFIFCSYVLRSIVELIMAVNYLASCTEKLIHISCEHLKNLMTFFSGLSHINMKFYVRTVSWPVFIMRN